MLNYRENKPFLDKVRNFPVEVYRLDDENTKVYQLMYALLEVGIGTAKRLQEVAATMQRSLANTRFSDLDMMYGSTFNLYRLDDEIYTYDPYSDALTSSEWSEVDAKDAAYRHRISLLLSAFQFGGSAQGIAMIAEAASGIKCDVFEAWRDDLEGMASTTSTREFVIVPRAPRSSEEPDGRVITEEQEAAIVSLVNLFKPVNTICTVAENTDPVEIAVPISYSSAVSEAVVTRTVVETEEQVPRFVYTEYQDEFCLNDDVSLVDIVEERVDYTYSIGTLGDGVAIGDATIAVTELNAPSSPVFYCKIDDEIVLVTDRVKDGLDANTYIYTVTREQNATVAAEHLEGAAVLVNFVSIVPESPATQVIWGPWTEVGLADSPDNYPNGKYPSRPDRYDKSKRYIFEFKSQADYLKWLLEQIKRVGGETRPTGATTESITHYRVPLYTLEANPLLANNNDLLAACPPEIITRVIA